MADLTVTITESVSVTGNTHSFTDTLTITGVDKTFEQSVDVPHTGGNTQLLKFGAAAGLGQLVQGNVKYVRITNEDATNFVELFLGDAGENLEYAVKVLPGTSHIFTNLNFNCKDDSISADTASRTDATTGTADHIIALADSATVKVQVFVAYA
jgi:hypothetical protein